MSRRLWLQAQWKPVACTDSASVNQKGLETSKVAQQSQAVSWIKTKMQSLFYSVSDGFLKDRLVCAILRQICSAVVKTLICLAFSWWEFEPEQSESSRGRRAGHMPYDVHAPLWLYVVFTVQSVYYPTHPYLDCKAGSCGLVKVQCVKCMRKAASYIVSAFSI